MSVSLGIELCDVVNHRFLLLVLRNWYSFVAFIFIVVAMTRALAESNVLNNEASNSEYPFGRKIVKYLKYAFGLEDATVKTEKNEEQANAAHESLTNDVVSSFL